MRNKILWGLILVLIGKVLIAEPTDEVILPNQDTVLTKTSVIETSYLNREISGDLHLVGIVAPFIGISGRLWSNKVGFELGAHTLFFVLTDIYARMLWEPFYHRKFFMGFGINQFFGSFLTEGGGSTWPMLSFGIRKHMSEKRKYQTLSSIELIVMPTGYTYLKESGWKWRTNNFQLTTIHINLCTFFL